MNADQWKTAILNHKREILEISRMALSVASCMTETSCIGCLLPVYINVAGEVYIGEDVCDYAEILAEEEKGDRICLFFAYCGQPLYRSHSENDDVEMEEVIWDLVRQYVMTSSL